MFNSSVSLFYLKLTSFLYWIHIKYCLAFVLQVTCLSILHCFFSKCFFLPSILFLHHLLITTVNEINSSVAGLLGFLWQKINQQIHKRAINLLVLTLSPVVLCYLLVSIFNKVWTPVSWSVKFLTQQRENAFYWGKLIELSADDIIQTTWGVLCYKAGKLLNFFALI